LSKILCFAAQAKNALPPRAFRKIPNFAGGA
jgi:hypothetical protein